MRPACRQWARRWIRSSAWQVWKGEPGGVMEWRYSTAVPPHTSMNSFELSWIEPDKLAAGPRPSGNHTLQLMLAQGIRAIISLTEQPLTLLLPQSATLLTTSDIQLFH